MSLTLMHPFSEMDEMFDNFDHSFDEFEKGDWMPAVDIEENDKSYMVRAELPGVHKDDVHVTIESNVLTIKGEKKVEIEDTKRHRVERSYGSFVRSFTLPQTVKTHGIGAEFVDGVLSLTITKRSKAIQKQYEVPISCGCNSMNCDCGVTADTVEVEKSQIKGSHSCGCTAMNCGCGV